MKEKGNSMENIQITNDYFNRIKVIEYLMFYFGWMGIFCCVVEYELRFDF